MINTYFRLMFLAILIRAIPAYADGGTIQFQRRAGSYIVTLFTSSTPVRVGLEDMSVMIQSSEDPHPLLDGEVFITASRQGRLGVTMKATREQAQNKLLYAAGVQFPEAGHWEVKVDIQRGAESFHVAGDVEVATSRSPFLSYWRWLAFPPLAILLFVCNQILKHRLRMRNRSREGRIKDVH